MDTKPGLDRRSFVKIAGCSIAAGTVPATGALGAPIKGQGTPKYSMVMDTRKCIGCMACVAACKSENSIPLGVTRTRVDDGERGAYPNSYRVFLPQLCNQCESPPCIPVCPVDATFRNADGLVVIDQRKCIACGLCVNACPYGARFINPVAKAADKCDFCESRRKDGLQPACVEVCPTKARVFGQIGERGTEFAKLSGRKDLKVLKPELKTKPAVKYVGL
jgi:tetrathionate reductase subunit B